jgi:hypothetical protein
MVLAVRTRHLAAVRVLAQVMLTPADLAVLLCQARGSAEEEAALVQALEAARVAKETPARAVDPVQAVVLAGAANRAKLVDPVQVRREARAGEVGTRLAR